MNRIFFVAKAVVLIWMASVPVSAWASSGYIYDAAGSVSVAIGKDAPHLAVKDEAVTSGMTIRTGDNSYAVLKFEDGEVVNLQADSTFLVREYIYNPKQAEKSNIVFSMFKGSMRFVTGLIGQHNKEAFRLATPNATVGIRGTDFLVVIKNGKMYIKVLSGSVNLTNAAGTVTFTAGQIAVVSSAAVVPAVAAEIAVPADVFVGATQVNLEEALAAQKAAQAAAAEAAQAAEAAKAAEAANAADAARLEEAARVAAVKAKAAQDAAVAAAGGAATGGAGAATTATGATAGVSGTAIAIGIGVAAGVAALVTSTTTHH